MMFWGYPYTWPMMLGMFFWGFFWLALVGIATWAFVRWLAGSAIHPIRGRTSPAELSALEILRQRYARGEIDTTTFEQMKNHLEGSREQQVPNVR